MDKEDMSFVFAIVAGSAVFISMFGFVYLSDSNRNQAKIECVKMTQKPVECLALFK